MDLICHPIDYGLKVKNIDGISRCRNIFTEYRELY